MAGWPSKKRVSPQTSSGIRMKLVTMSAAIKGLLRSPSRRFRKGICRNIAYISMAMLGVIKADNP
ncbi:hypothetical protein D3C77_455940 [compost metagenome]